MLLSVVVMVLNASCVFGWRSMELRSVLKCSLVGSAVIRSISLVGRSAVMWWSEWLKTAGCLLSVLPAWAEVQLACEVVFCCRWVLVGSSLPLIRCELC